MTNDKLTTAADMEAEAMRKRSDKSADALVTTASEQADAILKAAHVAADDLRQEGVAKAEGIILIASETAKMLEEKVEEAIAPLRAATLQSQAASKRSLEIAEKMMKEMQETMKILKAREKSWTQPRK